MKPLEFIEPMECKPVKDLAQIPVGAQWQYELKFDGYRCIAIKNGKETTLFSRNGRKFTQFPNVVAELASNKAKSLIIDGEIVALDESARPDFNALQNAARGLKAHFFAFDLLHFNGKDFLDLPLLERQGALGFHLEATDYIHLAGPIAASVSKLADEVARLGFEGIVAKRRDSIYTPGKRSGTWIKKKIKESEEFIIGGFIPSGNAVDTLVVGRYAGRQLKFVGAVDDGFVPATRRAVFKAIEDAPRLTSCPFVNLPEKRGRHKFDAEKMRKATWIKPVIVVEIAMNEWTPDRHLRHSEFLRLRPELHAKDVAEFPPNEP